MCVCQNIQKLKPNRNHGVCSESSYLSRNNNDVVHSPVSGPAWTCPQDRLHHRRVLLGTIYSQFGGIKAALWSVSFQGAAQHLPGRNASCQAVRIGDTCSHPPVGTKGAFRSVSSSSCCPSGQFQASHCSSQEAVCLVPHGLNKTEAASNQKGKLSSCRHTFLSEAGFKRFVVCQCAEAQMKESKDRNISLLNILNISPLNILSGVSKRSGDTIMAAEQKTGDEPVTCAAFVFVPTSRCWKSSEQSWMGDLFFFF